MTGAGRGGRWLEPDERVGVDVTLNGTLARLEASPRWTLADSVRAHGLTGTHVGCEHGVCGACTVLLDGEPVRACLVLAVQAEGRRVGTIEGLAEGELLHRVQTAFVEHRALQCGFCTPGFVVLSAWLLEREPDARPERIREVLSSNLCRCTGYGPVLDAVLSLRGGAAG